MFDTGRRLLDLERKEYHLRIEVHNLEARLNALAHELNYHYGPVTPPNTGWQKMTKAERKKIEEGPKGIGPLRFISL